MIKTTFPLSNVYTLLEPGPVVLVSTVREQRANIMTLSWLTMMDFMPPLLGCVIDRRNDSFASLKAGRECVINIPSAELADKVVAIGNCSGRDVDKFSAFALTPMPAKRVNPPLIAECYAHLECRLIDTRMASRYNLFVLRVVQAWIDPTRRNSQTLHHRGRGAFMISGNTIRLPSRMK